MEQSTRKRGRTKLFLTKEMLEERKLFKHLCKNSRRNLQDNLRCKRSEREGGSTAERATALSNITGKHFSNDSYVAGVTKWVENINNGNNNIERVDITLLTDSLLEMKVSVWGIHATFFGIDFCCHRDRNAVIVATSLLRGNEKATRITFNPRFEKVTELGHYIANEYGEFICAVPGETHLGITANFSRTHIGSNTDHYILQYSCKVTIIDPLCNQREPTTCIACGKQVTIHGNTYYCMHCARKFITPIKRLEQLRGVYKGSKGAVAFLSCS
ncbi:hypothetical protein POM88_035000 [Heracleum sosnowskyi]|uniref:Uncharacterized protein n=1 Tax=Heracleum sosnowskyi TaxID=360622 RepID=A0AAD8HM85_9APIA|nr:hypothetical protein POM88_035000 [Heracleum sosnowskyi]